MNNLIMEFDIWILTTREAEQSTFEMAKLHTLALACNGLISQRGSHNESITQIHTRLPDFKQQYKALHKDGPIELLNIAALTQCCLINLPRREGAW